MPISTSERDPVEKLAEEFVERHRRGERPALSEYTDQYPQWAEQIRELFPALALIERLKPAAADATGAHGGAAVVEDRRREQLGEYRVLREVGRGGMGVVYEAEQESLGRHVALKVLLFHQLSGTTYLERFRREARAAGRLHHTNIVPVFGVGESDGLHYYAMQFIHGEGLDKVVRDLRRLRDRHGSLPGNDAPLTGSVAQSLLTGRFTGPVPAEGGQLPQPGPGAPPADRGGSTPAPSASESGLSGRSDWEYCRGVARLGAQAADALAYAHRQGVLHRDVKPSNLLLDLQGTVWITDFGLAKAEGTDELTHTGDIVGTIRFMAPERFDGQSLPQSDVYSLGLTLYELLTLRPAFEDGNKARLIERILHEDPVPPRQVDRRIPRDLETVVLKALAKDPAGRYATAEQMAEDLRRFLADRPIRARRNSSAERAWRWCRRNPVVAALSAALLLLLTVTAVAGVALSLRLNDALGQAQEDRDKARDAEREGKGKLFESYVSGADATRLSRRPGQRFGTLRSIRDALEVARDIGLSEQDKLRLRNIAIAALCLPDLETGLEWPAGPDQPLPEGLDPVLRRRVLANYALARLPPPAHLLRGDSWYSPDGRFVAAGTLPYINGKRVSLPVRLWRVDGPKPVLVREFADGPFEEATAFRPDSRQVAFGHADGAVSVYDTETGQPVRRLGRGPKPIFCLAYHPRLPRLAVGDGTEVTVWDAETGRPILRLPHTGGAIAWHPRGHRLATASGKEIQLWDAETGQPVTAPWRGHLSDGIRLSFDASGHRLVSNDWHVVLRLWDAASGQLLLSLPGVGMARFGADGESLGPLGAGDRWRVLRAGGQELRTLTRPTPRGSERFINFSLHPEGRLLAASTPSGLGFFDLLTGEETAFVSGPFANAVGLSLGRYSRSLEFDRTGALWTTGSAGLVRWPVSAESPHRLRLGPPEWVADLLNDGDDGFSASADGRVAAVPLYSRGALVVHRGPPRRTLQLGPQYDVRWVFVSPDGRWVVTGSHFRDGSGVRYKVWEADTGRLVANLPSAEVEEFHGFSPDSRWLYVSGKENRRLEVASLAAAPPRPAAPAPAPAAPPWQANWRSERVLVGGAFSPDNRLAAFGRDDGSIQLVLAEKDEEIARLLSPEVGRIHPSRFSPDGALLLAVGEETGALHVFDLRRIRARLAELGLDWDLPAYRPARPEETNPALAPPLQVEPVDAEWAASRRKMAEYVSRRAAAQLFFNPFDAEAHYRLGTRLLEAGDPERARAHLGAALAFRPALDEALYPRARAAFQLERWADAVAEATRCLEKYPFQHNARYLRARANRRLKRYEEAVADSTAWIETYPSAPEGYELRALCYAALGKPALAKADREQAIKLGGREAATLNNQAWQLLTGPIGQREPVKALALIQEAVKQQPGDATLWNTLGVAQYRNGQYREALATLGKSLAAGQGQSDAFDLFFLAMCHARLGERPRAKDCFDRAVRWCQSQKDLSARHSEELKAFRAEAEDLLKAP